MLGFRPADTFALTLPELMICLRGWQRANGLNPEVDTAVQPMTRQRLLEIIDKETKE